MTGLLPGTAYLYRVKSYYVNGTESSWSSSKEVILKQGESMRGDVDRDGKLTIDDAILLGDYLLGNGSVIDTVAADCDLDGQVTIEDLPTLIDRLLGGAW